ncbi:MAG: alkaline shock response membrane anchor protein AmaP [Planctomycetota bacterium]|nr:alkaline shock response membrane anchor protein AmaP [Planctomycetota bacterium]
MRRRWFSFLFYLFLALLTCVVLYLLLSGGPKTNVEVVSEVVAESGNTLYDTVELKEPWNFNRIYWLAKVIDDNPWVIVVLLGLVALIETVTALMHLSTPVEERMIRYVQNNNEVLVNLDTIATTLENTVRDEPDVHNLKVLLRVPPGKQLHIHCFIRLDLREQVDIPSRVEQIRERIRTHFEQALPLEAKFSSSMELKVVTSDKADKHDKKTSKPPKEPVSDDFHGPRFPVDD